MRWMRYMAVGVLAALCVVSRVRAEGLDAKTVPGDVKWLLHVDVDALGKTKTWGVLRPQIEKMGDFQTGVANVEMITGMKLPDDLHDVTVYGKAFVEDAAVVVIRATVDQQRLIGLLQGNPAYSSVKHGQRDVHTWDDKGKQVYGSFHGPGRVVMGRSEEAVKGALDSLDGKREGLKAESPLAAGTGAGILLYVAGDGLSELTPLQAKSALVRQVERAWVSLREQEADLVLKAAVTTKTPETAGQVRAAVEGVKAMVLLAAANENAGPWAKAATEALQKLSAKVEDRTVTGELRVAVDSIDGLLKNIEAVRDARAEKAGKAKAGE